MQPAYRDNDPVLPRRPGPSRRVAPTDDRRARFVCGFGGYSTRNRRQSGVGHLLQVRAKGTNSVKLASLDLATGHVTYLPLGWLASLGDVITW